MQVIRAAGKRPYTFLVGKPNVAKLANFPEIDVFVLVACPEMSFIDSRDFLQPVVTPWELEMACNRSVSCVILLTSSYCHHDVILMSS